MSEKIKWLWKQHTHWMKTCKETFTSLDFFSRPWLLYLNQTFAISSLLWRRKTQIPWWRHQMETFSALLAICAGNSPVTGEFPTQRPVTRSFDVFFDLCPNERLSKQLWGWWFGTLWSPLWRHRNALYSRRQISCWRHQMEPFSRLLVLCEGNPLVTGGFPSQRSVTRSFDVFFDLRLNRRCETIEAPVIFDAIALSMTLL